MAFCEHIYNYTNPGSCNKCGTPTHDIIWDKHVVNNGLALKIFQEECCINCSCK